MTDIKLKSGRTVYANDGIISLNEDMELTEGYDSTINIEREGLTTDDLREIATIMIARWEKFRSDLE